MMAYNKNAECYMSVDKSQGLNMLASDLKL